MRQLAETRKDLVEVGARDVFAAGDPAAGRAAARAVSLVRNKTLSGFDPATGQPVQWDGSGGRGTTAAGGECFARINPCVIGLVKKPGEDKILLGRNAVRSGYFSALAGYCEPGETLEQAFMREVFEESGVTITGIRYVSSQPWPDSGSLMVAFTAVADPSSTPRPVDGELAEVGWFSARQISSGRVPLPRPGSVARRMIDAFAAGELIIGDN
nr:NAD(+) diphosphatase [Corynebacterium mendelii]